MTVLTAAEMREVDRQTAELGIPGLILMENAAHGVVEVMERAFGPLASQQPVVLCGKGNNGGDGLAIARQLLVRYGAMPSVVLVPAPEDLQGDAATNYRMLLAAGGKVQRDYLPSMATATLVVDALLGSGLDGPPRGEYAAWIAAARARFPTARFVAVDIPSGMASDGEEYDRRAMPADLTVTFTAPKRSHVLAPNCDRIGRLIVVPIGSRVGLVHSELSVNTTEDFALLVAPRTAESNKGTYGHALVIGGSRGKTGAAAMTGMAALRAGAGFVTVAAASSAVDVIAAHAPELMTAPLPETAGHVAEAAWHEGILSELLTRKNVVAVGPGLGTHPETMQLVRTLYTQVAVPLVVDADGLNALADGEWPSARARRVLTPHPGEMARLTGRPVTDVQRNREGIARDFASRHRVTLVLKGHRTLIAEPDGHVWVNPTGTPALATAGTGDILTGLIAGLIAQFPDRIGLAVRAAVWLHGRAGELGAGVWGDQALVATDLLRHFPEAMRDARVADSFGR